MRPFFENTNGSLELMRETIMRVTSFSAMFVTLIQKPGTIQLLRKNIVSVSMMPSMMIGRRSPL